MSEKLKIYACSGIGAAAEQEQQPISYWTGGTNTIDNTQAINGLLAKINATYIRATKLKGISEAEKINLLCDVDWLTVALEGTKHFATDNDGLHRAGEVIAHMISEGVFEFSSTDTDKREEHLEELIDKFYAIHNDGEPLVNVDPEFMNWWKVNIEDRNKSGLNFGQKQNARKALKTAVAGIGKIDPNWKDNPDLANYLLNGGTYFLYTYFTDAQLDKLPAVFKIKAKKQRRTYNYCKALFVDVYGTEEDMQDIIRAGIVSELECEPEEACANIAQGNQISGIGFLFGAETAAAGIKILIELLAVIGTILLGIIAIICDCVYKSNAQKYGALDKSIVETSCPDESDYSELESAKSSVSSWIPLAIIGVAAAFILKN